MKQFITEKESLLPLDGMEVLEDELMFILGGAATSGAGSGCGCGCSSGAGCGCGCDSGAGCGCNCGGNSPSGTSSPAK